LQKRTIILRSLQIVAAPYRKFQGIDWYERSDKLLRLPAGDALILILSNWRRLATTTQSLWHPGTPDSDVSGFLESLLVPFFGVEPPD